MRSEAEGRRTMTITEYYQIKADVERELNNTDFGFSVGSPMTVQDAMNQLADTLVACFVHRYYEGFGEPRWQWNALETFRYCNMNTQVKRINEAYAALSPEDQIS